MENVPGVKVKEVTITTMGRVRAEGKEMIKENGLKND